MNELQITPISEQDKQESYVYKNPVNGTVQKLYWRVNQDYLQRYARIQNSVWEVTIESDDDSSIPFGWELINRVVIKILEIPEESHDGSSIVPWENYKKPCVILEPKFVWWISLMEFADENEDDEGLMWLLHYIERCVETTFMNLWIFWAEFIQENAKITNLHEWELEITLTDIAWNSPHMVRLTEDKLYYYRFLLLWMLYTHLFKMNRFLRSKFKKTQN